MIDSRHEAALALLAQGRRDEGVQMLRQAARAGHVPSMTALGRELLSGQIVRADTELGILLILDAAKRGGGEACAIAANLCAWGYSGRPDWPRALDYLQRAAELGFQPARAQLRLLSGYQAGIDWKKLRRAVDAAAWWKLPPRVTLCEEPLIQAAPGLIPPRLCEALIELARPRLAPAKLEGGDVAYDVRHHSSVAFLLADTDLVVQAVHDRVCALVGVPAVRSEILQLLHYKPGDFFAPHHDFLDPGYDGHLDGLSQQGQRNHTILVYLNHEGLEGGETDFPELGLRHRGKTGDALLWRNVDLAGQPDRRTLHAGLPPIRGEKWVLSVWVRDRVPSGYDDPRILTALASPAEQAKRTN